MINWKRSTRALILVLSCSALIPLRGMAQNSAAQSWRPWEQELLSDPSHADYTASNGNPYRDLVLSVQYWRLPAGTTSCGSTPVISTDKSQYFASYGFWEGVKKNTSGGWDTNTKRFLIRSAFPDGTWCWKTTCQRSLPDASASTTPDCANDSGLNRTGQVTVSKTPSTVRLYALGLPQLPTGAGGDPRSLVYGDNATKFLWLGDTAWDAPINYGNGNQWTNFVNDRTSSAKDFRTVLVAPATQTVSTIPTNGFKGFANARTDCSAAEKAVVPNRCSTWDAKYWEQFDNLVVTANSSGKSGLMVIVAGVMDPLVRGGDNNNLGVSFPRTAEAKVFARNLAARLAGYFVFFSPSYDTKTSSGTTVNQSADGTSVIDLIKAVGGAIKSAAPRHLIGVHLAGSNPLEDTNPLGDYLNFSNEPWFGFQMFQSGHGASNAGAPCDITDNFQRSVCRAREAALELRCIRDASTTPLAVCVNGNGADRIGTPKPAVNVEGEYESAYSKQNGTWVRDLTQLTPSRARSRHTAWATALSGSFGFNIAFFLDITAWINPAAYSNSYTEGGRPNLFQSDDDLGRMSALLGQTPWDQYVPGHTLVCGNFASATTPDPCGSGNTIRTEDLKRHIGITDKVILVHVPGVSTSQQPVVKLLSRDLLAGLTCSSRSMTWVDPRGVNLPRSVAAKCAAITNGIQVSVPPPTTTVPALGCSDGQNTCDWILMLQSKTLASANAPNASGDPTALSSQRGAKLGLPYNDLQVWTEVDPDSQGTSVWAQLLGGNGDPVGDSFLVHPVDPRLRSLPTATRDSLGNFLVVWEEEGDISATYDVVAVQISNDGVLLGDPLHLNSPTYDQNGDPAATSDSGGGSYVTWTEYPLDGSQGNIWIAIFSPLGTPPGDGLGGLMVTDDPGNQFGSQVQADGQGGVVVAWNSDPPPADATRATRAKAKPAAGQGVYFRKLHRDGTAWGPVHGVHGNGKGRDRLVDLKVKANGKIKIVWRTVNDAGAVVGTYEQDFDSNGNPASAAKRFESGS